MKVTKKAVPEKVLTAAKALAEGVDLFRKAAKTGDEDLYTANGDYAAEKAKAFLTAWSEEISNEKK